MKALLNWRYYVLMVVGMIAVIGTFSVPIDDQPLGAWLLALIIPKIIGFGAWWKIQCKLPPKTKAILPPCAKIILPP